MCMRRDVGYDVTFCFAHRSSMLSRSGLSLVDHLGSGSATLQHGAFQLKIGYAAAQPLGDVVIVAGLVPREWVI